MFGQRLFDGFEGKQGNIPGQQTDFLIRHHGEVIAVLVVIIENHPGIRAVTVRQRWNTVEHLPAPDGPAAASGHRFYGDALTIFFLLYLPENIALVSAPIVIVQR